MRLLIERQHDFRGESRDVLRAGLGSASWISVDDTGARHARQNGFCTQVGNDDFTWFGTRTSRSQLNFLDILRAGHTDYVINATAGLHAWTIAFRAPCSAVASAPRACFADHNAWQAHLQELGITDLQVMADPVGVATEGALWGSVIGARLLARHPDPERRRRAIRRRSARAVLGAR